MGILLNVNFALAELCYWAYYAAAYTFATPVMLEKGYTNTEIGLILGITSVISVIFQAVVANYMDTHPKVSTIHVCIVIVLVCFPLVTALLFFSKASILLSVIFGINFTLTMSLQPFINNINFKFQETRNYINFGICRAGGSLGYSLTSNIAGKLSDAYGVNILLYISIILAIVFLLSTISCEWAYRKAAKGMVEEAKTESEEETSNVSYGQFIKNNIMFVLAMFGFILFSFGDTMYMSFPLQFVSEFGGTNADMGNTISLSAILEIPALFLFSTIERKFRLQNIIIVSAFFYCMKTLMYFLASSVTFYYLAQCFTLLGFPFMVGGIVPYVNRIMTREEANRGQTLFTISMNTGSILASFLGGYMMDNMGPKFIMTMALIMAITGFILFFYSIMKVEKKYEEREASN